MHILGRPQSLIFVMKFAVNAKEYNQVDRIFPGVNRFPNAPRKVTEPQ
jgi:hypothetical protein